MWYAGGKLEGLRGLQRRPRLWPPRQMREQSDGGHQSPTSGVEPCGRIATLAESPHLLKGPVCIAAPWPSHQRAPLLTKPQHCQTSLLLKKRKRKNSSVVLIPTFLTTNKRQHPFPFTLISSSVKYRSISFARLLGCFIFSETSSPHC